jgi:hypothetical protein
MRCLQDWRLFYNQEQKKVERKITDEKALQEMQKTHGA